MDHTGQGNFSPDLTRPDGPTHPDTVTRLLYVKVLYLVVVRRIRQLSDLTVLTWSVED
jgi:hypothetical protein